jgi:hypothetical protein
MTPAELLSWAARMEREAEITIAAANMIRYECDVAEIDQRVVDFRLAARLARFAAERGGLEEGVKDETV